MLLTSRFHYSLIIAAILIACVATLELLILDILLIPPFVIAFLLLVLSVIGSKWPKPVAGIAIVISILVPIGAIQGYLQGNLNIAIPIFDVVLFSWVIINAANTLKHK